MVEDGKFCFEEVEVKQIPTNKGINEIYPRSESSFTWCFEYLNQYNEVYLSTKNTHMKLLAVLAFVVAQGNEREVEEQERNDAS